MRLSQQPAGYAADRAGRQASSPQRLAQLCLKCVLSQDLGRRSSRARGCVGQRVGVRCAQMRAQSVHCLFGFGDAASCDALVAERVRSHSAASSRLPSGTASMHRRAGVRGRLICSRVTGRGLVPPLARGRGSRFELSTRLCGAALESEPRRPKSEFPTCRPASSAPRSRRQSRCAVHSEVRP